MYSIKEYNGTIIITKTGSKTNSSFSSIHDI